MIETTNISFGTPVIYLLNLSDIISLYMPKFSVQTIHLKAPYFQSYNKYVTWFSHFSSSR